MKNYKITNTETGQSIYTDLKYICRFWVKNENSSFTNKKVKYFLEEPKQKKELIDYIPTWLIIGVMVIAFYGSILLHCQLNY